LKAPPLIPTNEAMIPTPIPITVRVRKLIHTKS
jgi:hypothetical protein